MRSELHRVAAPILLLLFATACDGPAPSASGAELFKTQGCTTCHGIQAQGSALGPALVGVAQYWRREDLATYLRDPQAYLKQDARLSAYAKKYSIPMNKFSTLSEEALLKIADHVLELR